MINPCANEQRILILPPTAKDGAITARLLTSDGIPSLVCASLAELCDEMHKGAAALIVTQEAVLLDRANCLQQALNSQEAWSDIPVILLSASGPESSKNFAEISEVGHMTIIKRPVQLANFLSTVQAALRDRKRQYGTRKYLQERAEQADKLKASADKANAANTAKSNFLANMSHEIRTPMNAILGLSTILERTPLNPDQAKYVKTLRQSGEGLLMLINDLLDISKIESSGIEIEHIQFRLDKIVEEIVNMMSVKAKEKKLHFVVDITAISGCNFYGDPTRIRQIITNLCSNALKFTDHGTITIQTGLESLGPTRVNVFVTVADTGCGIPADKLEKIFDKFTQADNTITRKFGGTGLGLAISKTLAELMAGEILVSSTLDVGSEFTLIVPLSVTEDVSASVRKDVPEPVAGAAAPAPKGLILLVEDYEPNVLVASTLLETFGYECEVASSGKIALEKATRQKFTAILMDVQMPEMNGFDATQAIRAYERKSSTPPTPIIGMTAHALSGDRERCLAAGMNDYISKPFAAGDLQKKLEAVS